MAINLEKMKAERARRAGGGETWNAPEGDTAVYIAPPSRDDDDAPYWGFAVHWGLGKKGKNMSVCLDATEQPILQHPDLLEELKKQGKNIDGGCPVCDELAAGHLSDDCKRQSRWLWIVSPIKTRASAQEAFRPWNQPDFVTALLTSYRVWDSIADVFGSAGEDITNPESAVLVRIIREGTKLKTKWDVQPDFETLRKGMKIPASTRKALADACKKGGKCDPYRIIASMARSRDEVVKLLAGTAEADDEYDETDLPSGESGSEQPAAASDKMPPKPGAKAEGDAKHAQAAKAGTAAPKSAKPASKGDGSELDKLKAKHGDPPACFTMDPDSGEEQCRKCPFKKPCAETFGVPVPPDITPAKPKPAAKPAAAPPPEPEVGEKIAAKDCVAGQMYLMEDGTPALYKGSAKQFHFFVGDGDKRFRVKADDLVESVPDDPDDKQSGEVEGEAAQVEDEAEAELKRLEEELSKGAPKKKPGPAAKK